MKNYIDGFVLPVPQTKLHQYQQVAEKVAEVWKEYGALDYREYVADNIDSVGTRAFADACNAAADDAIIFGWVEFESRADRNRINDRVAQDQRMADLVSPLTEGSTPVFNANRMIYDGFRSLVCPAEQQIIEDSQ